MRLNPDCIRDILFTVEDVVDLDNFMIYDEKSCYDRLLKYDTKEVMYHIKQCELSGLLTKVHWFSGDNCAIIDLSPTGHQFLADVRSDMNWNKTKEIAKNIGSTSLDTLRSVAGNVIADLMRSQFLQS